jgi:hypothetical protein
MDCEHKGFHSITSRYDRGSGVLVFVSVCERCGKQLREVSRLAYRPRFESDGRAQQASPA